MSECKLHFESTDSDPNDMNHRKLAWGEQATIGVDDASVLRRVTTRGHMQACVSIPGFDRAKVCSDNLEGPLNVPSATIECDCKPGYTAIVRPGNDASTTECVLEQADDANSMPIEDAERRLAAAHNLLQEKKQLANELSKEVSAMTNTMHQKENNVQRAKMLEEDKQAALRKLEATDHARNAIVVSVIAALFSVILLSVFAVHVSKPKS